MQNGARTWVRLKETLLLINMCFEISHSIICSNLSISENLYSCIQYLNDIKFFSILFFKWHWLVETLSRCFKALGILGFDFSQETVSALKLTTFAPQHSISHQKFSRVDECSIWMKNFIIKFIDISYDMTKYIALQSIQSLNNSFV